MAKSDVAVVALAGIVVWLLSPESVGKIERLWGSHLAYEFDPSQKSTAKTMATMIEEPVVNHVPTMIGGHGQTDLAEFYENHFIFTNPPVHLTPVKRTVQITKNKASLVDEMVVRLNHTVIIDWLLPDTAPTGHKIAIPLVASVDFLRVKKEWKISRERIYWDQASVLKQVGLLKAKLPITGAEQCDDFTTP